MKIGVIADDLTGANATGVCLSKKAFRSATVVFGGEIPKNSSLNALCFDTDSRYVQPQIAAQRVLRVQKQLDMWGADVIAKRIDSTVRGNLGSEIDALLEIKANRIAVVIVTYPDSGRSVTGGYLLVDGVPVEKTDVAKDPMNPITDSHVPSILQKQSYHKVTHITLSCVLQGQLALREQLVQQIEEGSRIIVIDAISNEDIDVIAEAMMTIKDFDVMPVDPGPLTAAYGYAKTAQSVKNNKIIVTVGSITSLTGCQLQYVIDKRNANPVYVNPQQLASVSSSWDEEIARATAEAFEKLFSEDVLIITTYSPRTEKLDLWTLAKEQNVPEEIVAKRITEGLAMITNQVVQHAKSRISGSFSSGGDVTAAICAISGAEAIQLYDEVLPRAAFGRFIGGTFDGIPVVTKGGTVGDKHSIDECIQYLINNKEEGRVTI
ncbi:four-carbon acid sugar kinase family protein [Lysinibacillus parviboronicapiens]|uniref:four-carbon acid sugar kinase family protein n=1 Tax=Lysinibacillus parviboronicapiens TaxID=436516 RepID=UPI000D33F08B|nr:four-carbon acid sugar kinase family protein [Lysinibacillus parviboronicapiens]